MFYRVLLKKFSTWFTTISFILSWIVVNFTLPISLMTMSSNHEVYASTDNGHTHIVFHHSKKHSHHKIIDETKKDILEWVDKKGVPISDHARCAKISSNLKGIIVLDGTWSQAKALWWRNPWLLKLRRAILID